MKQAISHNEVLSIPFLEHVVGILNQVPADNDDNAHECDSSETSTPPSTMSQLPQAATIALGAILRHVPYHTYHMQVTKFNHTSDE
jgi:hypothetical protein